VTAELPNGDRLELPDDATGLDAARVIGEGLARAAIAIEVDGELRDLSRVLPPSNNGPAKIRIITERDPEALEVIRHDAAHVLAETVKELYPGVKISIGPPIADGFYYDFDFPDGVKVGEDDLERIEQKMREHIKADEKFERTEVPSSKALERFKAEGEDYKVELIEDLGADTVSLYRNGDFTDLCRGPHGPGTKRIKALKLTSVAGAYWRGDSNNPMLTRIYGTAFFSKDDLEQHLRRIEEAKARDHRKLGRELGLFDWDPVSPGATFWFPKGTVLFNRLVALNREMQAERGYEEVKTPQLYEASLWETSGHWGKYKENIFVTRYEDREFGLKPMNCPGHCKLFSMRRWSYRELPFRAAEPGLLHRREPSGTLHGLLRVRHFAQDDAHIFCREDQVSAEVQACMDFGFDIYRMFGFPVHIELSTRPDPDKRLGDDAFWDKTEGMLHDALERGGYEYTIAEGEGAFYAPKIDLHMTDTLGRSWQLGTVQLDYNMPQRFGLTYAGEDNAEHMPVMIHRALFGSFERFIGILLEHTAGELPFWLAPVQVAVLPIADDQIPYAREVTEQLGQADLRVEVDERGESIGKKIRDAELQKIPYMLVVGKREVESGEVALRRHREGDIGAMSVNEVVDRLTAASLDRE
jgi:threonyl-tRNA synthetase